MRFNHLLLSSLLLFAINSFATQNEKSYFYKVIKEDALSVIVYSIGLSPVETVVSKVHRMNPDIKNVDRIEPNSIVYLPKPNELFKDNFTIASNGEVFIKERIVSQKDKISFLNRNNKVPRVVSKTNYKLKQKLKTLFNGNFSLGGSRSSKKINHNSSNNKNSIPYTVYNTILSYEVLDEQSLHTLRLSNRVLELPSLADGQYTNEEFSTISFEYLYKTSIGNSNFHLQTSLGHFEQEVLLEVTDSTVIIEKLESPGLTIEIGYSNPSILNVTPFYGAKYFAESSFRDYQISGLIEHSLGFKGNLPINKNFNIIGFTEYKLMNYETEELKSNESEFVLGGHLKIRI